MKKWNRSLIYLAGYTVCLYISLPFVPSIWNYLSHLLGSWIDILGLAVLIGITITAITLLATGREDQGKGELFRWVGIATFFFLSLGLLIPLHRFPAERLHLAEYGVLALIALPAFKSPGKKPLKTVTAACLACFIIGTGDELIQGMLPNREFELRDIMLNFASSLLVIYLVGFLLRERLGNGRLFSPVYHYIYSLSSYPLAVLGVVLTVTALSAPVPKPPFKPNIVILTIDALRPDHMGCYGYPENTTPNIDIIAISGVIFEKAYGSSAWTSPNIISILSGMYPSKHGVFSRGNSPRQSIITLPEVLRSKGYLLPDLNYLTNDPNFYFLGFDGREKEILESTSDAEQGQAVVEWLKKREIDESLRERPFFIWYHCTYPHLPYEYSENLLPRFLSIPLPDAEQRSPGLNSVMKEMVIPSGTTKFNPSDSLYVKGLYDCGVRMADYMVGNIQTALENLGEWDKTVLIITADHGEELLDHGHVGHASTTKRATLFEEVIRIPLIVHYPRCFLRNVKRSELVQNVDIYPTILDLLEISELERSESDGLSFLPLLKNRKTGGDREWVFCETNLGGYQGTAEESDQFIYTLIRDDYKVLSQENTSTWRGFHCFDLLQDPLERTFFLPENDPFARIRFARLGKELKNRIRAAKELRAGFTEPSITRRFIETVQNIWSKNSELADGRERPENPVIVVKPTDGATVLRRGSRGRIILEWRGDPEADYIVEYKIGDGDYRLEGSFPVEGTKQEYGPFDADAWGRMIMYNPWNFRVWRERFPDTASNWIRFVLSE